MTYLPSNLSKQLADSIRHSKSKDVLGKGVHAHTLGSLAKRQDFIRIDIVKSSSCDCQRMSNLGMQEIVHTQESIGHLEEVDECNDPDANTRLRDSIII